MKNNTVVVFCKDQADVNAAVQEWANVKGYKRVYTSEASTDAAHFHEKSTSGYTRCANTPIGGFKIAVIFEGD